MPAQKTPYGYLYPQPVDPVRDGAVNIGNLANQIKAPELYSGQPCLAGAFAAQDQYRIRMVVYNYSPATDAYGLMNIPLPFTTCCLTATIMPRDFRQQIGGVMIAQEYCTVTNLCAFVYNFTGGGAFANQNAKMCIVAWGF